MLPCSRIYYSNVS